MTALKPEKSRKGEGETSLSQRRTHIGKEKRKEADGGEKKPLCGREDRKKKKGEKYFLQLFQDRSPKKKRHMHANFPHFT